ncbi:aspartate aminotransferase family protein [[Eubacterium] cellulosolvens]
MKSEKLFERAKKAVPGGVHSNARYLKPFPLYFQKAKGSQIWDIDGNEYTDYFVAHGAIVLGHAYPQVEKAVKEQMELGLTFGVESELTISTAEDLVRIIPHAEMARFTVSGSESVMSAIHIARGYTGKKKIIKTEGAWHGVYDYVCASYRPLLEKAGPADNPHTLPESSGFIKEDIIKNTLVAPFNDTESMEKIVKENKQDVAAVILEPIIHNAGAIMPQPSYLKTIREITRDNDVLLIFDEVITGFRGAPGGAQQYYDVTPDISTFGKAIANGYPLAAVVGKKDILQVSSPDAKLTSVGGFGAVIFAGTFHANHLSVAACKANISVIKDGKVAKHLNDLTNRLIKGVEGVSGEYNSSIRVQGLGGQFTIYFSDHQITNYREAISTDNGTGEKFLRLQKNLQDQGIRLLPRHLYHHGFSYSHTRSDIDHLVTTIKEAVKSESL